MIQDKGRIKVRGQKQAKAVIDHLCEGVIDPNGRNLDQISRNAGWLYWIKGEPIDWDLPGGPSSLNPQHTLADFGLDEEGNHLPTFGNLKFGDPNPFEVGMEVCCGNEKGRVVDIDNGPSVRVDWYESRLQWTGFGKDGPIIPSGVSNINTIFPVKEEESKPTHTYEFGDKVKALEWRQPLFVLSVQGERMCAISWDQKDSIDSKNLLQSHSIHLSCVTPWTELVTIPLTSDYQATVTADGIKVGCQDIGWGAFDELAKAAAKIRNS